RRAAAPSGLHLLPGEVCGGPGATRQEGGGSVRRPHRAEVQADEDLRPGGEVAGALRRERGTAVRRRVPGGSDLQAGGGCHRRVYMPAAALRRATRQGWSMWRLLPRWPDVPAVELEQRKADLQLWAGATPALRHESADRQLRRRLQRPEPDLSDRRGGKTAPWTHPPQPLGAEK